ncbi:hypothetical protein [Haladaptatus sp. YSMS36]|uniref:hypothetical protein n=1 Tax=Haladaptatus sp. YSMS36 TaxID=3033384 RepID=UPI0023E85DDE|nr:hypothetical protein [Haladaptatus sp. YSMS36]
MYITYRKTDGGTGLEISDTIERRHYSLLTDTPVTPRATDAEQFLFPVDEAVSITTTQVTLPTVIPVYVRDAAGQMLAEAEHFANEDLPAGDYSLELCAPMKIYLRTTGPLTITGDAQQLHISFAQPTEVLVGARSHHKHPAATITTTEDPFDMMAAISAFGSALKTTSAERSYPTLRGHPPLVELGDELHIPEGLVRPDTGISIEIPPEPGYIFVAAPLAYYLGAELVPGVAARILTDTGFEYPLGDTLFDFENTVEALLQHVFFLDCITRTEGFYKLNLHERHEVESVVDIDFAALYDQPLAVQLEAYLSIPFETLDPFLPEWKLTSHVSLSATSIETLPFLVDDLAIVRTPQAERVEQDAAQMALVDEFLRDGNFMRSGTAASAAPSSYVKPQTARSLEQAWIGEGAPLGASKTTTQAFHNRLARDLSDGDIDITVVCNDPQMDEERDIVDRVYGSRSELLFDIEIKHNLTTEELAAVLQTPTEFLHYIGHIDSEGFECVDGKLDVTTLDEVGVDAFFLNACSSYEQGMALIEKGAIGGIVTLSDVINSGAVKIGGTVARLLNGGFPLASALEVAKGESIVGGQYAVVGDGSLAVAQAESGIPLLWDLERVDDETYTVTMKTFPTTDRGMGSLVVPYIQENGQYFLGSGRIDPFEVHRSELLQLFLLEDFPVRIDGQLRWSSDITHSEL